MPERDPVRDMVFEVARVADALMSDHGYTRKMAAQSLVNIARKHRDASWSDEDFAMIQGAARKLATVVNLPPLVGSVHE